MLDERPSGSLIVGGGYIACEFAGIFNGMGSEVTQWHRGAQILRGFDDEARGHLTEHAQSPRGSTCTSAVTCPADRAAPGGKPGPGDLGAARASCRRGDVRDGPGAEHGGHRARGRGGRASGDEARSRSMNGRARASRRSGRWATSTDRIALTPMAIREGHAFADTEFGGMPATPITTAFPGHLHAARVRDGGHDRGGGGRGAPDRGLSHDLPPYAPRAGWPVRPRAFEARDRRGHAARARCHMVARRRAR